MNNVLLSYINRMNKKIELLKKRNIEIRQEGTILAFRGESKDYGKTKLMPSIYRNEDYIRKEKYLFNLLEDYDVITAEKVRNIETAIEAQHYVSISRMLRRVL